MSVAGSRRRDTITYGVNGTRSNCGEQGVSWLCWCGWGSCATILFVGARGLRAARGSVREAVFGSCVRGIFSCCLACSGQTTRSYSVRAVMESDDVACLLLCTCPVRDGWRSAARCSCSTTGVCTGGDLVRGGGAHVRMPAGLRSTELVVLVTITVARDTPLDCHFSAWSRPKPAPDPLPGPSVASGVIPTKGGRNGSVPTTSGRAPEGRWRSSPWKRCNHAAPRGRGQGAPRTARCIKTSLRVRTSLHKLVREHPAPLGALRHLKSLDFREPFKGQGAPRTAIV